MVAQSYEMDCIVTEIIDAQGSSYWLKAFSPDNQELGFAIDLEQIVDIMTEIPDSMIKDELFVSRDFLVTVHVDSALWVKVTEYESGVEGEWDPEDGGPVSWEDWEAMDAYLDSMDFDDRGEVDEDEEDEFLELEEWEPGGR